MKKLLAILITVISVFGIACAFVGCGNEEEQTGVFYTVTEAYEKGFLTREQVMSIAYYHNGGREHNEAIMDENYNPLPKAPEKLSSKTKKSIKQTYFNAYLKNEDTAELSDIRIADYLGTYNGCIPVMLAADEFIGYAQVVWIDEVDGIKISYNDGNHIMVWSPLA